MTTFNFKEEVSKAKKLLIPKLIRFLRLVATYLVLLLVEDAIKPELLEVAEIILNLQ